MQIFSKILLGLISLNLCACLSSVSSNPQNTYMLSVEHLTIHSGSNTSQTLQVNIPKAMPGYETSDMIYTTKAYELKSFSRNRWQEAPSQLLYPLLLESLRKTHHYKAVVTASSLTPSDLRLDTELVMLRQEFSQHYCHIRLIVEAQMIFVPTQEVLNSRQWVIVEPCPTCDPYGGVLASNRAVRKFLHELAAFAVAQVPPPPPPPQAKPAEIESD